jgi:hypothetical protein
MTCAFLESRFAEAYGQGVIDALKMVQQETGRQNDDCRLVIAEHPGFSINRIFDYYRRVRELLPRFAGLTTERSAACYPLQLADLAVTAASVAYAVRSKAAEDDSLVRRLRHQHSFHIRLA